MFQRLRGELKGAFDTIADEQARLRAQQSPSAAGNRRPPGPQRTQKPRPNAAELSGPDPDPIQFIVGDETPIPTPDPASVSQFILDNAGDAEASTSSIEQANGAQSTEPASDNVELPSEIQAKLKKLERLESKYSELLKAYKRAHTRNSFIEPFEAQLRESTPLTSIADPSALVDYLKQLNVRGDMAMEELKKVTTDRDSIKSRLEEAEKKTKAAYDEVAQLRGTGSPATPSKPKEEAVSSPSHTRLPSISSPILLGKSLFSQRQNGNLKSLDSGEDVFSVEEEVPRLQKEIEAKDEKIGELEDANQRLRADSASARESAEQMMHDLEQAQHKLESLESGASTSSEEYAQNVQSLKATIADLEERLKSAESAAEKADAEARSFQSKLEELEKGQAQAEEEKPSEAQKVNVDNEAVDDDATGAKKKKNKKKKKRGGATNEVAEANGDAAKPLSSNAAGTADERNSAIDRLNAKLKDQEEMKEEIEHLREELSSIGLEHVDAKEKVKSLEAERAKLQARISELEGAGNDNLLGEKKTSMTTKLESLQAEIEQYKTKAAADLADKEARQTLSKEFDELKVRSRTLETDLSAAQQLAASRYKEMTGVRDLLQKAQPELTSLRTEITEVRSARDDLVARNKELRKFELREEHLRNEVESLKREMASKETEIRTLTTKIGVETTSRIAAEETNRRSQRELQRAQTERQEATTSRDSTATELASTKSQLDEARLRLKQLERQVEQLSKDVENLRDEIGLKTAQHASAESLMSAARDQAAEMATQMKEARERCESLEEELHDAHRLMSERGREGETMRRLLSEVESRAESRVKEMRERMDLAVQERDRAEDEANNIGRRRTREVEEAKARLRDVERDVRRITEDKEDIERSERQLRRQREDDERRIQASTTEAEEVRRAMAELRDNLDEADRTTRELDTERVELKRSFGEAQTRLEKLQKSNKSLTDELRSLRTTRMRPTNSPSQSSRSSFESQRRQQISSPTRAPGQPVTPTASTATTPRAATFGFSPMSPSTSVNNVDFVYLKNVLLQFMEQRDKQHQMQLVPVLSMLLKFDKRDEEKWSAVIASR